jgi:hypothetical protein
MPGSCAKTGLATAAERIAIALSVLVFAMGFSVRPSGRKPAVGKDVPVFQTGATFTFRTGLLAAGAMQSSMLGQCVENQAVVSGESSPGKSQIYRKRNFALQRIRPGTSNNVPGIIFADMWNTSLCAPAS